MKTTTSLITDEQRLTGAQSRFGHAIKTYDDGSGPLFILRDSMGIVGIVRADTWEDAYSIAEDELFPEADETVDELQKEYGFHREHVKIIRDPAAPNGERPATPADYSDNVKLPSGAFVRWETVETPDPEAWHENEIFQECFGFRPNGANESDVLKHGIYAKDLNGEALDLLTPRLAQELEITLSLEAWE